MDEDLMYDHPYDGQVVERVVSEAEARHAPGLPIVPNGDQSIDVRSS